MTTLLKGTYTNDSDAITLLFDCMQIVKTFMIKHNYSYKEMCYIFKSPDRYNSENSHITSIKTKLIFQIEEKIIDNDFNLNKNNHRYSFNYSFDILASLIGISLYTRYGDNYFIIYKVIEYYLQYQFSYYTFKEFVSILNS